MINKNTSLMDNKSLLIIVAYFAKEKPCNICKAEPLRHADWG